MNGIAIQRARGEDEDGARPKPPARGLAQAGKRREGAPRSRAGRLFIVDYVTYYKVDYVT